MELRTRPFRLKMRHPWTIATDLATEAGVGNDDSEILFVDLRDGDGVVGIGEAAPSGRYGESPATVESFMARVDPKRLSFGDVGGSMAYLDSLGADAAGKGALNIALLDGAARREGKTVRELLGLDFEEGRHVTSFSIGIDSPEAVERKTREAEIFPILKLKLGAPNDRENLQALRSAAPEKTVRVDGNEGWKDRETALRKIEWLAEDGNIEFVEQPMPAASADEDLAWLKERSPLPVMADESYVTAADLDRCHRCYHAVNVKLVKAGGISGAKRALEAARAAGLKTMIGCMIESSVLISAAAQLAGLADFLDLDGNLLIRNDPYEGVAVKNGVLTCAGVREAHGLQVRARNGG